MNLTNTVPAILAPVTILVLVGAGNSLDWPSWFLGAAVLAAAAAMLASCIRDVA